MQPHKPQEPGSTSPTGRKGSLSTIFSKKNFSFSKKERVERVISPTSPHPPEQQEPKPGDPNGYVGAYTRVPRNSQPTEEDLKSYSNNLRDQLAEAWPQRYNSRYKKAYALLVCWADNDPARLPPRFAQDPHPSPYLGSPSLRGQQSCMTLRSSYASEDVRLVDRTSSRADMKEATTIVGRHGPFVAAAYQLSSVFERRYGYNSQIWMVPNIGNPQEALAHKLRQFIADYGSPDNLLIFWYGGHAEFIGNFNRDSQGGGMNGGDVIWYGLRDELGIQAKTAARVLANSRADVWMINDSPFAYHAYVPHAAGLGSFELLGSGSTTPSNLEMNRARECSLTRTLTLMLDSPYLAASGVSILELHRKLLDMQAFHMTSTNYAAMRSSGASNSTSTSSFGTSFDTYNNPAAARSMGGRSSSGSGDTLFHNPMNNSLIPARCKRFGTPPAYPIYCQIAQAPGFERDTMRNIVISKLDTTLAPKNNGVRFLGEDLLVRMDIKLKRPSLGVRRWKEWILRAPADANGVRLTVVQKESTSKESCSKESSSKDPTSKETTF